MLVWGVLALATLAAAALRLPFLDHQSLWLDEIFTRDVVREPSLAALWDHVRLTESTPPLYYALTRALGADSAPALRLVPALSLVAAVPVAYLAFRTLVGQRAALATSAIVAASPMLAIYATDARSYGLFVLTALLSVWGFAELLDDVTPCRGAAFAAACVACVWTHYFGAFVVAAEVVVLLIACPRSRRAVVGWTAAAGACLVPLAVLVAHQGGDDRAGFIGDASLLSRASTTVRELAMGSNVPRSWLEGAGIAVLYAAIAIGALTAWRSGGRRRAPLALVAIVAGAPLLLAAAGIVDRFYARNVIAALPLAAAVAAPALLRLRAAPLVAYLAIAATTSVWVATDWRYEQSDWKGALALTHADRSAPVVAFAGVSAPVVRAYLGREPALAPGPPARRAWIVVAPSRPAGSRGLTPGPVPALAGFAVERAFEHHGFRIVLVGAPQPTSIPTVAGALVFPGA
jgi:hypothetical protein